MQIAHLRHSVEEQGEALDLVHLDDARFDRSAADENGGLRMDPELDS